MLTLDERQGVLCDEASGRCYGPARREWSPGPPVQGVPVSPRAAVAWLQQRSGHPLREPVAVIGPGQASELQLSVARDLGAALGSVGLRVVCGGRGGVMEAVARGVAEAGGISIGLLPGPDAAEANRHLTVALATGIGEARNAIVARAGFCLVAVGDSYGTLSEVALGLQFGRPVIGLCGAAQVAGVVHVETVEEAVDRVAAVALGLTAGRA